MSTNQITGTIITGVSLSSALYDNPVTVTNTARVSGSVYGIYAATGWAIENAGTITGTTNAATDGGVSLGDGGSVTNAVGGSIGGGNDGVRIVGATGTVDNSGAITGTYNAGVYLNSGSVTNQIGGSISGATNGVDLTGGGTIDNLGIIAGNAGAYANGLFGVFANGSSVTVENAGTISGAFDSVDLQAGGTNRLIVDAGAVFYGAVYANLAANNTMELKSGAAGTIIGFGSQYQNFQTVTIDNSAIWDVDGAASEFNGTTIDGFNSHDRLDLASIGPAGYTVSLNSSTDLLTIKGGSDTVTIQLDGSVTGATFQLLDDNNGGAFVEESDYTPCYCRGTRIRTPQGKVAVEALRIGDRVTTVDGEDLPIKWIGRRFYRDWLAVGNAGVQPICFRAGSIADGVPVRDLYVSPEHAMFLDGVLVPALHLVNGASIVKIEGMEEIEYFHFEFDRHVVIYAEGAAAESFVDDDSRMLFHNADEYRQLYPDEPRGGDIEFCAPRVEAGYEIDTLHRRLVARAERLLPGGTAAPAGVQQGYLDRATRTMVEGWAFGAGEGPVKLAVIVNGAVVGRTVADRYRAGLGVGDGRCCFRFDLPHGLSPDVSHRIEVRRVSDWSLLTGGRATLTPVTMPLAPHPAGRRGVEVR
jgi:hypothetical protein